MLQFLYPMFNLFVLLRNDTLKPATPVTGVQKWCHLLGYSV